MDNSDSFTSWSDLMRKSAAEEGYAHLWRESTEVPVLVLVPTGLRAAGIDLTLEQCWWPGATGDRGVSGVSVSAALPLSRNTSLAPKAPIPAGPGDMTREGRAGLTSPAALEEEPLAAAAASVTGASGAWLPGGGGTTVAQLSLPLSRCSSAAFWLLLPLLRLDRGRPSSEILVRNKRAACLLLESLTFLRCCRCVFAGLLLLAVDCKPQRAVAILVWNVSAGGNGSEWPVSRHWPRLSVSQLAEVVIMCVRASKCSELIG